MIFLLGPTAVGKSEVAIELASRIGGEIVSADSMQIYRGMDVGTAKPLLKERRGIPHHLMDVMDIHERCDVARFRKLAHTAILDIRKRGAQPIIVGGSGLYVRALTQGLFEGPGRNEKVRADLDKLDTKALHERLKEMDSDAAARISPQDRRRMIRALEFFMTTGQPISAIQTQWIAPSESLFENPPLLTKEGLGEVGRDQATPCSPPCQGGHLKRQNDPHLIGLNRPRAELYRRCDARVEAMFPRGFIDEVRDLMKRGLKESPTAAKAIGYREVMQHLSGELALDETIECVKKSTRNFVKRQLTWFRREPDVKWMDLSEKDSASEIAARIQTW